jgi:hypothetical protein
MGCQRNICKQINDSGGDYFIGLKVNFGIMRLFDDQDVLNNCSSYEEADKGHGRLEIRKVYSTFH